jgi:hypothetical protein
MQALHVLPKITDLYKPEHAIELNGECMMEHVRQDIFTLDCNADKTETKHACRLSLTIHVSLLLSHPSIHPSVRPFDHYSFHTMESKPDEFCPNLELISLLLISCLR